MCACEPILVENCNVHGCSAFLGLQKNYRSFTCFSNKARYGNRDALSFGTIYNSVAQKLRILAIKAIFDKKNPFLTNSTVDRIKIKAETTLKCQINEST